MRMFYLINSRRSYGLNKEDNIFISDVGGLGVTVGGTYSGITGKAFFTRSGVQAPQGQIVGNLNFIGPSPYSIYKTFSEWLMEEQRLTFGYKPDTETYYCAVELASLSKTELSEGQVLSCPVVFNMLTPWTQEASYSGISISIPGGTGHYDTALLITVSGAAAAPQLTLTGPAGEIGGTTYADALAAGDVFQLSTVPGDSWARLNGSDVTGKLTLSGNPFFRIPAGVTATLACNASMTVKVFRYWRTV